METDNRFLREHISVSKEFCKDLVEFLLLISDDVVCRITDDREGADNPHSHANPMRYKESIGRLTDRLLQDLED